MDKNMKECEMCGEMKPLPQFSKSYKNRCKQCVADAARQRRADAKEQWQDDAVKREEEKAAKRYELTKIALQGIMAHADIEGMETRQVAEMAVDIADETLRALSIMDVIFENI